jgi:homoserine O-acetyltransferase
MFIRFAAAILFCFLAGALHANTVLPAETGGDYAVRDFRFRSGETLPRLNLHYTTLGHLARDGAGHVTNAVLILHGTGGDGHQFLRPQFAGVLFTPGRLLDPARYFIVLPDGIGHGKSSKPSDGLHAHFPSYDYDDMVQAQYLLLTKGLGVDHLRLLMGTSMGCMHGFVWSETHPDFIDALMPLACLPVQIAGRNRMWREMAMDAIRQDPAWKGGDYSAEPLLGLRGASDLMLIAGSAPRLMQEKYPTRDAADEFLHHYIGQDLASLDANDLLYQLNASRDYDPSGGLGRIRAPVMWVNSADDFINPPELGVAEKLVRLIPHGRFVLLPVSDATHGHGTHTWAAAWRDQLAALLTETVANAPQPN